MASIDTTDNGNNDYDDEDWYVEPEDDGVEISPASNENTAKRPLPALPPSMEKSKPLPVLPTKKPEGFKLPTPPAKPNEVPSEAPKAADVVLRPVSKAPDPPSKPAVKSGTDFHKKPDDNERPTSGNPLDLASQLKAKLESRSGTAHTTEAPEKPAAKPGVSKFGGPHVPSGKPSLPQKDSHENNHPAGGDNERASTGGSLDFASQLKAKFESRSAGSEGSDKPSAKPGVPNSGGGGAIFPSGKPSLAQKDSHGNKPSAGGDLRPVLKPPSKPTGVNPPPPLKPTIPTAPKTNQSTGKPTPPSAKPNPPAPPAKSGLNSESNNNQVTGPNKVSSDKTNVKNLSTSFNAPSSNTVQEKSLPGKPQLPGKPKPAPPSKSSPSNQSSVTRPGTQNVNSLANNLSGKLHFGQNPLAKVSAADEGGVSSSAKPPPPATKKPAAGPAQNAPASGGSKVVSPMANMYNAVCSFVAENEGELGFTEGDEVEVLEEQSDWCRIRCWDEEGWAPASYLQKL